MRRNHSLNIAWDGLFRDFARKLWLLILAGCIGWMGVVVYENTIYSPKYTSTAVLAVCTQQENAVGSANLSVTKGMAKVYSEVFRQPAIKQLAAEHLGMKTFDGAVRTIHHTGTNLITLTVTAADAPLSCRLLDAMLEVCPALAEVVFTDSILAVMQEPEIPTTVSNPPRSLVRIIGMLAATVLAAGWIVLRACLDRTIRNEAVFCEVIDAELLETVVQEDAPRTGISTPHKKNIGLRIDRDGIGLLFSEDIRRLAIRLESMHRGDGASVITVTAARKNEGVSTIAANLAIALTERGYRAVLLTPDCVKEHLAHIRKSADFVIVDAAPVSVSAETVQLSVRSDRTVLVVRTDTASAEEINDAIHTLREAGGSLCGCVLNGLHRPLTLFGLRGTDETGTQPYSAQKRYPMCGAVSAVMTQNSDTPEEGAGSDAE